MSERRFISPRKPNRTYPMDVPLGQRFQFEEKREEYFKITHALYVPAEDFDAWLDGKQVSLLTFPENLSIVPIGESSDLMITRIEKRLNENIDPNDVSSRRHLEHILQKSRQMLQNITGGHLE